MGKGTIWDHWRSNLDTSCTALEHIVYNTTPASISVLIVVSQSNRKMFPNKGGYVNLAIGVASLDHNSILL